MSPARGVVAAAAFVVALVVAPPAEAHAQLVASKPMNGSVLDQSPRVVALRFDEPVEAQFGAVRVYDAEADRVDAGTVTRPDEKEVHVALDGRLARGTYTTGWRVVSADGHPTSGAFVFHVGAPGAKPAGIASEVLGGGASRSVRVAFSIVRAVDFGLLLLVVGGTLMLVVGLGRAPAATRRNLSRTLAVAGVALAVVAAAAIVLEGAAAGGFALRDALSRDVVSSVLETRFGGVFAVQAALALAVAGLLLASPRARVAAPLALVPAAFLLLTPSASGHASVSGGFALVADVAHVAAAAVWVGGLAALVLALLWSTSERWDVAVRAVPAFSALAVGAVALLIVSGTTSGYLEIRAFRGLWETTYGRLLLVKVALVAPLLALGLYNNRSAVPRLRAGLGSAAVRARFLRTAGVELALMVAIVGVTAVLVSEPPARAALTPTAGAPYATTAHLSDVQLGVVVTPATAGVNQIDLYLEGHGSGRRVEVDEASVSARLPSRQIGPLHLFAHPAQPGHFIVHGADLALAGDWRLQVEIRRGASTVDATTVSVPIRGSS